MGVKAVLWLTEKMKETYRQGKKTERIFLIDQIEIFTKIILLSNCTGHTDPCGNPESSGGSAVFIILENTHYKCLSTYMLASKPECAYKKQT